MNIERSFTKKKKKLYLQQEVLYLQQNLKSGHITIENVIFTTTFKHLDFKYRKVIYKKKMLDLQQEMFYLQ